MKKLCKMSHKQLSPIGNGDNESVINLDERRSSYKTLPYSVTRQILKQGEMEEITGYDRKKTGKGFCESLRSLNAKEIVKNFCPVFQWLPNYPVSKYLMSDIVSGFTVAIMHIPQGELKILHMFLTCFKLRNSLRHGLRSLGRCRSNCWPLHGLLSHPHLLPLRHIASHLDGHICRCLADDVEDCGDLFRSKLWQTCDANGESHR